MPEKLPANVNKAEDEQGILEPTVTEENGQLVIKLPLKSAELRRRVSGSGKMLLLTTYQRPFETRAVGTVRVGLNIMQRNPAYREEDAKVEAIAAGVRDALQRMGIELPTKADGAAVRAAAKAAGTQ